MIKEFIDLVINLFPNISPYIQDRVKDAIKQFEESNKQYECFLFTPFDYLSQGDIIGDLPFIRYNYNGKQELFKTKGLIISNSCDIENDKDILIAPLIDIKNEYNILSTIKKNYINKLLYFPDPQLPDYAIDLSLINTFSKDLINKAVKENKLKKLFSLTLFGYYLLLCKLTIHLMRPEDQKVQDERTI